MPPKGVPMSPEQLAKLALARAKAHEAIKAKAELTKTMNTKEKILKRQLVKDFVSQLKNPEKEPEPVAETEPEKEQEVLPKKKGRPRKYHLDEPNSEIKTEIKPEPVVAEPEPEPVKKPEQKPEPEVLKEKEPKKKVKKVIYQSDSDSEEEEVVIVKRKPKQRKQKVIYQDDSDSEPEMVYRQKSKSRQREYKEPEPMVEQPRRMNYANHLINLCKAGYQFS